MASRKGWFQSTQRRVVTAIVVTAVAPLVVSVYLGWTLIGRISQTAFNPEYGAAMERSLMVYADLVAAVKGGMKARADALARDPELLSESRTDKGRLNDVLSRLAKDTPDVAELAVLSSDGEEVARWERGHPVDPQSEKSLTVRRNLTGMGPELDEVEAPILAATFVTPVARFNEQAELQSIVETYQQVGSENRTVLVDTTFRRAFSVLVVLTIVAALAIGIGVARPVTRGVGHLHAALAPIAKGDLSVRVEVRGADDVADLGRAFNKMLGELEQSRAREEFLRRIGEWQKMARRMAHEIKNPLTPIQLAVEECHRRYRGDDENFRRILQTTLEVVEEEVGSLRRLVTEFSSFARLPRAELVPADLATFLNEQADRMAMRRSSSAMAAETLGSDSDEALLSRVDLSFDVADEPMPAALDAEMLHRVLENLVRNAAQAMRDARGHAGDDSYGQIVVRARAGSNGYRLSVEDDGPGVPSELRETVFDPYVSAKHDGTGLGLAIVKKVIVDHGGTITCGQSELGGAKFELVIPRADPSMAARTAA